MCACGGGERIRMTGMAKEYMHKWSFFTEMIGEDLPDEEFCVGINASEL